eukprot:CAMPEP_0194100254 /NCGR_PEP_ID=MMETSP0150-20130528/1181_1 /TAXON_ID=122233 /ORGANISM="Chaetoceros debilis, Strain MM31A-1" /LENGTH=119 /DNA_ID=CAMNT_0038786593 /DNA_START=45 /DNA_END=404 /DNA_ORIENTATION=+
MLSVTRITATRTLASLSSRAFVASGVHRNFSLAKDLTRKEKVEEDRYIRQIEHEAYLKRKAEKEARAEAAKPKLSEAEIAAKETNDIAVAEVFVILSKTGDKISDDAVNNLADWKLGKI